MFVGNWFFDLQLIWFVLSLPAVYDYILPLLLPLLLLLSFFCL